MKYTAYIDKQIGEFGTINAQRETIHKLSKIRACEAKILFYLMLEVDGEPNLYEMERFHLNKILTELTGNLEPDFCIPKIIKGEAI